MIRMNLMKPKVGIDLSQMRICRISRRVVFGDVLYLPGGTCGPRIQNDFQLVVLLSGALQVKVDHICLNLPPNHMVLMSPQHEEFYQFSTREESHHTWCSVSTQLTPETLRRQIPFPPAVLKTTPHIHQLIEIGLETQGPGRESDAPLLNHLGLAILYEAMGPSGKSLGNKLQPPPPPVLKAQAYVEARLSASIHLNELAHAAAITPQHLVKLFRKHCGTTPMEYVWRARVAQGVQLLRNTGLSIDQIADQTGFTNPFHFSRRVKQQCGMSPRELRNQAWGK